MYCCGAASCAELPLPLLVTRCLCPAAVTAALIQGCRLEIQSPLPHGEPLDCTAQLWELHAEPRKIRVTCKIVTGTRTAPAAVTAYIYGVVPIQNKAQERGGSKSERKAPRVPVGARLVSQHRLTASSGLHYACLTGDFNPIHWHSAYAKMSGFPNVILHGFAQMALVAEALVKGCCGGDPAQLRVLDVRFVAPVVLPGVVVVLVDDAAGAVYLSNAEGNVVHVVGRVVIDGGSTVPQLQSKL